MAMLPSTFGAIPRFSDFQSLVALFLFGDSSRDQNFPGELAVMPQSFQLGFRSVFAIRFSCRRLAIDDDHMPQGAGPRIHNHNLGPASSNSRRNPDANIRGTRINRDGQ